MFIRMVEGLLSKSLLVGLVRIELTTSSLSVTRSNRLSYSPARGKVYTRLSGASESRRVPTLQGDGLTRGAEQNAVFTPQEGGAVGESVVHGVHAHIY